MVEKECDWDMGSVDAMIVVIMKIDRTRVRWQKEKFEEIESDSELVFVFQSANKREGIEEVACKL